MLITHMNLSIIELEQLVITSIRVPELGIVFPRRFSVSFAENLSNEPLRDFQFDREPTLG